MTHCVVGVIGHVDHGKTALVKALTGIDTDRLKEEKQRGISIALGFAHVKVGPGAEIDLIDMPGHERFVRTMISGATGIDAVLLVVAANEGIRPQTVEHADIAGLLGLRRGVVAVTKVDLVEPEEAERVAREAKWLLAERGLEVSSSIQTSAVSGLGIDALRQALSAVAESLPARSADGVMFYPIDRAFSLAGHGPVVTGTLRGAAVTVGDVLEVWPARTKARVKAVQVHGGYVTNAAPGQRVAINLRGADLAALKQSVALAAPDTLGISDWLSISIRALQGAPPLHNGMRLRALLGAQEFDVRLRLLDRDLLSPGETSVAQLRCAEPIAAPASEHVILRIASPARTVAGGKILEPQTQRARRNSPSVLKRLAALRDAPADALVAEEVERAGAAGTNLARLSQLSALSKQRIVSFLQSKPVLVTQSELVVSKAEIDKLAARLQRVLRMNAEGLSRDALAREFPSVGASVLDEALERLRASAVIAKRSGQFMLPRPDEDSKRAQSEAMLAAQIAEKLRQGGLAPPDPSLIVTDLKAKRAVDLLLREGSVVRAVDRAKNKEILFHQEAIEEAQRKLAPLLQRVPGLLPAEVGAALGISRKYSMPLLDHLDTIRFTRRIKDRRILAASSSRE